ncbi:MAG: porin family protein [Acidobacteria bacterium]|nr:porin family protein [Acidobacteriota bacterium]
MNRKQRLNLSGNARRMWFFSAVAMLVCFAFGTDVSASESFPVYFRVGAGIAYSENTAFFDVDCHSVSPVPLFGCVTGNDGRPIGAYGDFKNSIVLDIGIGCRWNDWLRTEISVSDRPDFRFAGRSNFSQLDPSVPQLVCADVRSFSLMFAGAVRPLALFGHKKWFFNPFVKAGAGIARNKIDSMSYTFPDTETITPDGSHTGFAWSAGAGFSCDLRKNLELEVEYRHSDLGRISTDAGLMNIIDRSTGEIVNDSIVINGTKADLKTNEVLVSIVWFF